MLTRFGPLVLISVWAAVYTGSVMMIEWRRGNRRGAVGTGILAVMVLVLPTLLDIFAHAR